MSRHHRKSRCRKGSNDHTNISNVSQKAHRAFHLLFGHGDPCRIERELNETWIDPAYIVTIRRKL